MIKSGTQLLEQATNLPAIHFQTGLEMKFSASLETKENSIVEKISERLNAEARFSRLRKRMRSRSSNIL